MVKEITCKTDGQPIFVDDEDYSILSRFPWYRGGIMGCPMTFLYGKNDGSQTVYMHQIIMGGIVGTDHIDTNVMNMQKTNLRPVTVQQNGWNSRKRMRLAGGKTPSSQYKGVSKAFSKKYGDHWRVSIKLTPKGEKPAKFLRFYPFNTEEEAAEAYNREIVKLRGQYAWINKLPENIQAH